MASETETPLDVDTDVNGFVLQAAAPHSAATSDSQPGSTIPIIDGYEVLRELGKGGMGVVYLARDHTLDRLVALKTFHADASGNFCTVLTAEAKLSGKLNHSSIVPIFEVNASCKTPYFAMAFIEGEDLAQRIARQVYAPTDAARLGAQIAAAIQHAHEADVLHLDLKPANILLGKDGSPRVTDFGLFAFVGCQPESGHGGIVGTPQFMSPEQALQDNEQIGPASDIYSIGAVIYAAVTGRPPIVGSNPQELIAKVASQRPRPLRAMVTKVPIALDAIVMKCLQKAPEHRYASAGDLQADLEAFVEGRPVSARPTGTLARIRYQVEQHVLAASVSGSLALALLIFTGVSLLFQALENHYEVTRLQTQVGTLEQHNSQLRSAYASLLNRRSQEFAFDNSLVEAMAANAVQLQEKGDAKLAGVFAADAYLLAAAHGTPTTDELHNIIRGYDPQWADSNELSVAEMANAIHEENNYTNAQSIVAAAPTTAP